MNRDVVLKKANQECGYRITATRKAAIEGVVVDANYIGNYATVYTKAILHLPDGSVNAQAMCTFLEAFKCGSAKDIQNVSMGGDAKLSTPSATFAFGLEGPLQFNVAIPTPVNIGALGGDMAGLYALSLTRDIKISDIDTSSILSSVGITSDTVRGNLYDTRNGAPVSVFYYTPLQTSVGPIPQEYSFYAPNINYLHTRESAKAAQNGKYVDPGPAILTTKSQLSTIRDGASYTRMVPVKEMFMNILDTLAEQQAPLNILSSFRNGAAIVEDNAYLGGYDEFQEVLGVVEKVVRFATAYHKWSYMRLRPEELGLLVDLAKSTGIDLNGLDPNLLSSSLLEQVYNKQGNWLLSQAYREGAPTSPSYPSYSVATAAALATVIKAFYDETYVMPGGGTLGGEVNKIVSNISFFEQAAGIGYASDAIYTLGEDIALRYLGDYVFSYPWSFGCRFHLFNGTVFETTNSKMYFPPGVMASDVAPPPVVGDCDLPSSSCKSSRVYNSSSDSSASSRLKESSCSSSSSSSSSSCSSSCRSSSSSCSSKCSSSSSKYNSPPSYSSSSSSSSSSSRSVPVIQPYQFPGPNLYPPPGGYAPVYDEYRCERDRSSSSTGSSTSEPRYMRCPKCKHKSSCSSGDSQNQAAFSCPNCEAPQAYQYPNPS